MVDHAGPVGRTVAGWRVDPRDSASRRGGGPVDFVSPDELIDAMRGIRTGIFRRRESMTRAAARETATQVRAVLQRCPKPWLVRPAIAFELAETYAALGSEFLEESCRLYSASVVADNKADRIPMDTVEQLANAEAKLGEQMGAPDLIDRAIARLHDLEKVVAATVDYSSGGKTAAPATRANSERQSLVGSAYKRKAAIFAREILAANASNRERSIKNFREAIRQSIAAYKNASGLENEATFDPYPALNWLALEALGGEYRQGVDVCLACAKRANQEFLREASLWNAVMAAEAYLVETICDGRLARRSPAGEQAFEDVWRHYADALANVRFAPKDLDSVTLQLCLLALFFEARSVFERQPARERSQAAVAQRLRRLAERLQPGSCEEAVKRSTVKADSGAARAPQPRKRRKR